MADNDYIFFKCLEIVQPVGHFYVGAMQFNEVISIAYADVRRIEDRDVERYIGIQRPLEDKKVNELREYVKTDDASFPTSVILSVNGKDVLFDPERSIMRIRNDREVARIIDGQHRIAGLINYKGKPFQLNVSIFVNIDIDVQAHLFATINLNQTKVNRSLAFDLYELAKARSPQKTCHNIAMFLDSTEGSPFFHRVKRLGRATGRGLETLTQAAVVERLIVHISRNPMKDRDSLRLGEPLLRATQEEEVAKRLFWRNMFIEERDADITRVVWNFFTAVATKWPKAWNTSEQGYVLNKSAGFAALARLMADLYLKIGKIGQVPEVDEFAAYLSMIELDDDFFVKENFLPGSGGEGRLYRELRDGARLNAV